MTDSQPGKSRRSKSLMVTIITVVFITCIGSVAFNRTDVAQAAKDYEKNRHALEDRGYYFTLDGYLASLGATKENNAADLVKQVLSFYDKNKLLFKDDLSEKETIANWGKASSILTTLEVAAKKEVCVFDRDRRVLAATQYPEFASMKSIVDFLCRQAEVARQANNIDLAVRCWRSAAYLSGLNDDEHLLIGNLVRNATATAIEHSIGHELNRSPASIPEAAKLQTVMTILDTPYRIDYALKLENFFADAGLEEFLANPNMLAVNGSDYSKLALYAKIPKFKEASRSRIYEIQLAAHKLLPKDHYDVKAYQLSLASMDNLFSKKGMSYLVAQTIMPTYTQVGDVVSKEYSFRNVLMQYLEVVRTGYSGLNLPLKGRYLHDFDGGQIRFKRSGTKRIIYGVGSDKVDNGGLDGMKSKKGDFALKLPN